MGQMVYINGKLVSREEAVVSIFDRGLLYGYGLFETMRSYEGCVFRLGRHLDRLMAGAERLGLAAALDRPELEAAVYRTLEASGLADARVRLTVTAGEGERRLEPPSRGSPTVIVVAEGVSVYPDLYVRGVRAAVVSTWRNSQSPVSGIKSLNYLAGFFAQSEAQALGADEAIMLNEKGLVAECSTSNIFLVVEEKLVTPSVKCGILPGITREAVLELAPELGLEAVEGDVAPSHLLDADEVFLTTSVREIVSVVAVNEAPVGSGAPGLVARRLLASYRELVRRER